MRTGITRKVDDLGRVVIPAGIRRSLDMREGETVEVAVEGDQVILFKPVDECVFCGEEAGLRAFRGKSVCRSCIAAVGVLDDGLRDRPPESPVEGQRDLPPWPVDDGPNAAREREAQASTDAADRATQPSPRARDRGGRRSAAAERDASAGDQPSTRSPSAPAADERTEWPERAGRDDQDPPASTTAW